MSETIGGGSGRYWAPISSWLFNLIGAGINFLSYELHRSIDVMCGLFASANGYNSKSSDGMERTASRAA